MTRLVLDCSIAMAWCFEDEADPVADAVLASLAGSEAYVPEIWLLEVANVLAISERSGRIAAPDVVRYVSLLSSLPIRVDDQTGAKALGDVLHLARAYQTTAYDAAYLELAMRLGAELATRDKRLGEAAVRAGLKLFVPPAPAAPERPAPGSCG